MIKDAQVRRLRQLLGKGQPLYRAALRVGMDAKSARKYRDSDRLPSESFTPSTWRTREDPFQEVWPELQDRLVLNPGLQAKTLFEDLQRRFPGRFPDGQLRTLQRKIKAWKALEGPPKEVFFDQVHTPGALRGESGTEEKSGRGESGKEEKAGKRRKRDRGESGTGPLFNRGGESGTGPLFNRGGESGTGPLFNRGGESGTGPLFNREERGGEESERSGTGPLFNRTRPISRTCPASIGRVPLSIPASIGRVPLSILSRFQYQSDLSRFQYSRFFVSPITRSAL